MAERSIFHKLKESPLGTFIRDFGARHRDPITLRSGTRVGECAKEAKKIPAVQPTPRNRPSLLAHKQPIYANQIGHPAALQNIECIDHTYSEAQPPVASSTPVRVSYTPSLSDEESIHLQISVNDISSISENIGDLEVSHCTTPSSLLRDHCTTHSSLLRSVSQNSERSVTPPIPFDYQSSTEGSDIVPQCPENEEMSDFNDKKFNSCIPEFKGNPDEVNIFIRRCDGLQSKLNAAGKEEFYESLIYKLGGPAFKLFESRSITNWGEFKNALRNKFEEAKPIPLLQKQLENLKQNTNEPVSAYAERLNELLNDLTASTEKKHVDVGIRLYLAEEQDNLARRVFREGLCGELKHRFTAGCHHMTLQQLIALAVVEEPFANKTQKYLENKISNPSNPIQIKREPRECSFCNKKGHSEYQCSFKRRSPECSFCKTKGHSTAECFSKNKNRQKGEISCYRCNKSGHYANECRESINDQKFKNEPRDNNGRVSFSKSENDGRPSQGIRRVNPFGKNFSTQTRVLSASRLEEEDHSY